jgi:hypothetical protein
MVDGNATEMVVAMVHGNHSNGPQQQRRQWKIAVATVMVTATTRRTATEGDGHGKGNHD